MIVRRAGMADVAALADLRGIDEEKFSAYADWVAAHAETHLPFLAEIDGYVVGVAWLLVAERVPSNESLDRRYGDIQSVEVREEYRNQGIGGALMAAILAEARARGLRHVTVHSSHRAGRLLPAQRLQSGPPAPALGAVAVSGRAADRLVCSDESPR